MKENCKRQEKKNKQRQKGERGTEAIFGQLSAPFTVLITLCYYFISL